MILMARREEQGKRVERALRDAGGEATFIACDVGDHDSVTRAVSQAADTYGAIHVLFNNAGGGAGSRFPNEPNAEWQRVIHTNLTGTFYVSQAVWPHLVAAGGGAVVNMSSLAAQRGFSSRMQDEFGTTSASYYAAKAGVDALTRYMAGRRWARQHPRQLRAARPDPDARRDRGQRATTPTADDTSSRRCSISRRSFRGQGIHATSPTSCSSYRAKSPASSPARSSTSTAGSRRRSDVHRSCERDQQHRRRALAPLNALGRRSRSERGAACGEPRHRTRTPLNALGHQVAVFEQSQRVRLASSPNYELLRAVSKTESHVFGQSTERGAATVRWNYDLACRRRSTWAANRRGLCERHLMASSRATTFDSAGGVNDCWPRGIHTMTGFSKGYSASTRA